jgi:thiol-disulfide isomerase/thioredoxin
MRKLIILLFILTLPGIKRAFGQSNRGNSTFSLNGEIVGRDTGSIVLCYFDRKNEYKAVTVTLNKGRFHFSGTINRACETLIWTDPNNRNFDDPSVIRFLLEPNNIHITYKLSDSLNPVITGSRSQTQKRHWDQVKMPLLNAKRLCYSKIGPLAKLNRSNPSPSTQSRMNQLSKQIDSLNQLIRELDISYILRNPNTFLSAYLLSQHTRKLSPNSIQALYTSLSKDVKKSSVGRTVLEYIYPLTDDIDFRKTNPLLDLAFDSRLNKIRSVYDLDLSDTAGKNLDLNFFRGKYLVIDFWASWCKPCIENIPALNQMIDCYKSDSIEFISISLDNDLETWKKSIIEHHCTGVQLSDLKAFNSLAAIYCKALWVPFYVVVSPKGKIIRYDAPQASEPELKPLLDNLLGHRLIESKENSMSN